MDFYLTTQQQKKNQHPKIKPQNYLTLLHLRKAGGQAWKLLILIQISIYLEFLMVMEEKKQLIIVNRILKNVLKSDPLVKTDVIQALKNTFKKIDEDLEKAGKDSYYSSGCTANVMLIQKNTIIIANVGDSRTILSQKSGQVIQLSNDHKPELKEELARIKQADGEVFMGRVNGNLNLSRAVGDLEYKKNKALGYDKQLIISVPEITQRQISQDDDFLLMGCDGVYELFSNDELANKIKELMNQKYNGIGCDNMSAIIIRLNSN